MPRLRSVRFGICSAALLTVACAREPVDWHPVQYQKKDGGPSTEQLEPAAARGNLLPTTSFCSASMRSARTKGGIVKVWWRIRPDSSAILEFSLGSPRGQGKLVVVDSTDRSRAGCKRPAPALFADSSSGYIHIAYFIEQPTGAGVFVIHSMDGGLTFHSPVAVAFGARASGTAVAAEGDRVAVAYQQAIGERSQVFVALSTTAGHIFENGIPASEENADARNPRIMLHGTKLEVSWMEHVPGAPGPDRIASRTGTWK